jgi:hypothetical protein
MHKKQQGSQTDSEIQIYNARSIGASCAAQGKQKGID